MNFDKEPKSRIFFFFFFVGGGGGGGGGEGGRGGEVLGAGGWRWEGYKLTNTRAMRELSLVYGTCRQDRFVITVKY